MSWRQLQKSFLVKPLQVIISEECESTGRRPSMARSLTLFDLIRIGVGGTVGSGIFVLTGLIAREYAGPGVIFSWMLAGIACKASALSFAELSCLIPSAGSSFVEHTFMYILGLMNYQLFNGMVSYNGIWSKWSCCFVQLEKESLLVSLVVDSSR